jgi:haloacetate dehalogenase
MGSRHAGLTPFAPEALAAYEEALRQDGAASGICEDYRASATVDLDHEREDRDRALLITSPLRVLWGRQGVVGRLFDPLALWQPLAADVSGRGLECGHYVAEEVPDPLYREICEHLGD